MREKSDRPDKITCKRCGEVIVLGRRGRIPQYCERCRRKLWRDEKTEKRRKDEKAGDKAKAKGENGRRRKAGAEKKSAARRE